MIERIEIEKEITFPELDSRLRSVKLKAFPDVNVYENADIQINSFSPNQIRGEVFTPQPTIYRRGYLDRIDRLRDLFGERGIDIFSLGGAFDYVAFDTEGQATQWTLLPPVIERVNIYLDGDGKLDYTKSIDPELLAKMESMGQGINPELKNVSTEALRKIVNRRGNPARIDLICDGSHRIHSALEKELNQNILVIDGPENGTPYYAAPQSYNMTHVEPRRTEEGGVDKFHIVVAPGHKGFYRLFPTGGIMSGSVRSWGGDGKKE
jgi:hypothetical protein